MTREELGRIICAEASVMSYEAKWATGQCIRDNGYNSKAFTTPYSGNLPQQYLDIADRILADDVPFPDAKLIKSRSAAYYTADGKPDWKKLGSGADPFNEEQYQEIATFINGKWIAGFFGNKIAPAPDPESKKIYRVVAGSFEIKENAIAYQKDLAKKGIESFIVES